MEYANPVKLGVGGFGLAFTIQGGPIAFKEITRNCRPNAEILRREFQTLQIIYNTCRPDALFAVPRPFGLTDPDAEDSQFFPAATAERELSPAHSDQRHSMRPFVSPGFMSMFSTPTYAMDRVFALPIDVGAFIAQSFFPPDRKDSVGRLSICRLYFGRDYQAAPPSRFFNSENFPLDATRYAAVHKQFPTISYPVEEVARGMGEMIATMHFRAGVDARDVEFVLGSCGDSRLSYKVIDFDRVRAWPKGNDVSQLVSAFFDNDPYIPRPVPDTGLHAAFREGYLDACSPGNRPFGVKFLEAIEAEESRRSARRQMEQGISM